jgi:LysM repeat protein
MRLNKVFAILTLSILLNTYIEPYTLYHTVKRGENLYTIGKKYGKTPEEIKKLNNLKSSNLYPGQKLIVGVKEGKIRK